MRTATKRGVVRVLNRLALAWLLLGTVGIGRGEPAAPIRQRPTQADCQHEAARTRVTITAEQLTAAQSLRSARIAMVHATQAAHDSVERVRDDVLKSEILARADAAEAERTVGAATQVVEMARAAMERERARSLDRPLVAYDITQHGRLTVNALTGSIDISLENGPGITLGAGDIDDLLHGRSPVAGFDPRTLAADASSLRHRITTNRSAVRASLAATYGPSNVYLLSSRVLDWMTPERMSDGLNRPARLAGGSAEQDRTEARRQFQLEYEDFAAWLQLKGVKDLDLECANILGELIRGGTCPRLGLSIKNSPVDYTHRFEPAGTTELPPEFLTISAPRTTAARNTAWEMTERRPALAVIWNRSNPALESLTTHLESDFRLPAVAMNDPRMVPPTGADPKIRRLVAWNGQHGLAAIDTSTGHRHLVRAVLGPRKEDIPFAIASDRLTADARHSDYGEIMTIFVSRLAVGNRSTTELDVLDLDPSSGRLEAEFTLHHRHVWTSAYEAQKQLGTTHGSLAACLDNRADPVRDAPFIAARHRFHEAERAARDAAVRSQEAAKELQRTGDRLAAKQRDLNRLAGDLARARNDLGAAADHEAQARREAFAARIAMTEMDARVRLSRTDRPDRTSRSAATPILYSSREQNKMR